MQGASIFRLGLELVARGLYVYSSHAHTIPLCKLMSELFIVLFGVVDLFQWSPPYRLMDLIWTQSSQRVQYYTVGGTLSVSIFAVVFP